MEHFTQKPRAVVAFVPDKRRFLQEHRILARTWRECCKEDTDYVCFGPMEVARQLDEDIIFIEHPDRTQDYDGYGYANSVDIFTNPRIGELRSYTSLLRTDTDVFLTPAFRDLPAERFMTGVGGYVNDQATKDNLFQAAKDFGLRHRGLHNLGSTWYGPAEQVLQVGELTAQLTHKFLDEYFLEDEGEWPGWFRGVALLYAAEIAVNHLLDDVQRSPLQIDHPSTSNGLITDHAHIHCWHTDEIFSKFAFRRGKYKEIDIADLDTTIVRNYCLAMSQPAAGSE